MYSVYISIPILGVPSSNYYLSIYLSPKILRQNYLLSTSLELVVLVELGLLIGGGVLILLIFRDQIVEVGLGLEVEEILWQAKKCEMIGISIEDPFVRSFERERKKEEDSPR